MFCAKRPFRFAYQLQLIFVLHSCSAEEEQTVWTVYSLSVYLLQADELLTCLQAGCSLRAHIVCLAKSFLSGENEKNMLLPVQGNCPSCRKNLLWGDLIRLKQGCYIDAEKVCLILSHGVCSCTVSDDRCVQWCTLDLITFSSCYFRCKWKKTILTPI